MDERDLEAEHPAPRFRVDQLRARRREIRERSANVIHLVRNVMHSWAALRKEAAYGRVLPKRPEKLDAAFADTKRRRLDALLFDPLAMLEGRSEEPRIRLDRAVEIADGDPNMVNRARSGHRVDRM
jgi:hypothetical protein